jgi:hypothetical protein
VLAPHAMKRHTVIDLRGAQQPLAGQVLVSAIAEDRLRAIATGRSELWSGTRSRQAWRCEGAFRAATCAGDFTLPLSTTHRTRAMAKGYRNPRRAYNKEGSELGATRLLRSSSRGQRACQVEVAPRPSGAPLGGSGTSIAASTPGAICLSPQTMGRSRRRGGSKLSPS